MKKTLFFLLLLLIIPVLYIIIYFNNNEFEKSIKILDCEAKYKALIFNEPFGLEKENLNKDIATCLCEKYLMNKDEKYKIEILKLYKNYRSNIYKEIKNPEMKIDSICKNRYTIFVKTME